jgi:hypothetical protein
MSENDKAHDDDDHDRQLSVERAMRACVGRPPAEWNRLVRDMATPGFAVLLGKMLRISDELDEAAGSEDGIDKAAGPEEDR